MKFLVKELICAVCVIAFQGLGFAALPSQTRGNDSQVAAQLSGGPEQDENWLVEYESGGAEGNVGVPTHRASWVQIALAGMVMFGTSTLVWAKNTPHAR